ncbi:hypothetical protein [Azospirillum palustre]|jgi:hypothetical protein
MALERAVSTPYGIDATYHRIIGLQLHFAERCADVTLASYLTTAARQTDHQPLGVIQTRIDFSEMALPDGSEPGRSDIYQALKGRAEWQGATDC